MKKGIMILTGRISSWLALGLILLLVNSSCEENLAPVNDAVAVHFNSSGVAIKAESETITRASVPENLAAGTTVRVLAYKRKGSTANMATDTYMGENTYVADASGNLSACVTDDQGVLKSGTATQLYLRSDTYDFYAVTPAVKLINGQAVVDNGMDYAVSFTGGKALAATGNAQVTLETLERKCSMISFSVTRNTDNIASITVQQLALNYITRGPLNTGVTGDINLTGASTDYPLVLGSSAFQSGTEAYQKYVNRIVLPKTSSGFRLEFKLYFNSATAISTLTADVSAMAFEKGKRYDFRLVLKGESVQLTLYLSNDWNTPVNWNTDSGSGVAVVVGQWTGVSWQTSGGSSIIRATAWQVNPNLEAELKAALLAAASGGWDPSPGGSTDSGNGAGNTDTGGWGTNTGNDGVNGNGTGTAPGNWDPSPGGSTDSGTKGTNAGAEDWNSSNGGTTNTGTNGTATGAGSWNFSDWNTDFN